MNQRVSNEMLINKNKNNERETNAGALSPQTIIHTHIFFVCSNRRQRMKKKQSGSGNNKKRKRIIVG